MNELGELRPSQLIFTFGVGSLVDLPNMSAMVMGLDDWDTRYCKELEEDRLVAAVQKRLGPQMSKLYLPPIKLESTDRDPAAPAIGVPVAPFPRWMRCSLCDTLSTVELGRLQIDTRPVAARQNSLCSSRLSQEPRRKGAFSAFSAIPLGLPGGPPD